MPDWETVRFEHDELAERIEDAWLIRVPKRLAAKHLGSRER